jgi:cytochrome c-type biogenesis protein CcmF
MMRFWNAVLVTLTFGLSIFGTFLTRSGVVSSVHSFVSSPVGWWFIGALCVLVAGSMVVLARSRTLLRAQHDVDAVVSREGLLLFNNLLLVSLALVVLWGVTYPIMTATFADTRIGLQQPWYEFFAVAFGLPLTALLAFAPVVGWRGTPVQRVARGMIVPLACALTIAVVLTAFGLGGSPLGVLAIALGVLVVAGVCADFVRAVRARRAQQDGARMWSSLVHVLVRMRRRWGAWLAHAGIALVVVAVAGASWNQLETVTLTRGESITVGGYTLTYAEVERARTGERMRMRAEFDVTRGEQSLGTLRAGRDFHPASGEVSNEVGIRHDWLRLHDLFVNVEQLTETGDVTVAVHVNPLVPLLWIAGLMTALGGLIAAWPTRAPRVQERADVANPDTKHAVRV